MSAVLRDQDGAFPPRSLHRELWHFIIDVPIGVTGAVGTIVCPTPDVSVTRAATGSYTFTYPACIKAYFIIEVESADASPNILEVQITAKSATAGTGSFKTLDAAAADADPESGAHVVIHVFGETVA